MHSTTYYNPSITVLQIISYLVIDLKNLISYIPSSAIKKKKNHKYSNYMNIHFYCRTIINKVYL